MPGNNTPHKFPIPDVERISAGANCVSGLLSVIAILPEDKQFSTLQTCATMAEQVARDLACLVGGSHA